jgi:hypothetical protein
MTRSGYPTWDSFVFSFVRLCFSEKEGFNLEAIVLGRLLDMRRVCWDALHT